MAKTYRDLRVWQSGMDLVELVYNLTRTFPKPEGDGLALQMRETAIVIPTNIAAGNLREHTEEYLHDLSTAQASLAALQTQLEIAGRLHYLSSEQVSGTLERAETLGRWMQALRSALMKREGSPPISSPAS